MSFDIDQAVFRRSTDLDLASRAVFVLGLARSGTTILLEALHKTGCFRSLTYRDMPFVLMPRLWKQVSALSPRDAAPAERAHGDSILVGFDSPESFEEVFWRTFAGPRYIRTDHLLAHVPDDRVLMLFRKYVAAIVAADGGNVRYLSKNNNNILRLSSLRRAIPDAVVLVIFRNPMETALSLYRQHARFSALQQSNTFAMRYMEWLGHHEFGVAHRPFRFCKQPLVTSPDDPDYWLQAWIDAYEHVLGQENAGYVLLSYERLCQRPQAYLEIIGERTGAAGDWEMIGRVFRHSATPESLPFSDNVVAKAQRVYSRLMEKAT